MPFWCHFRFSSWWYHKLFRTLYMVLVQKCDFFGNFKIFRLVRLLFTSIFDEGIKTWNLNGVNFRITMLKNTRIKIFLAKEHSSKMDQLDASENSKWTNQKREFRRQKRSVFFACWVVAVGIRWLKNFMALFKTLNSQLVERRPIGKPSSLFERYVCELFWLFFCCSRCLLQNFAR